MSRLSKDQLNKLKEKFGIEQLYSFSRTSTFKDCRLAYKLKYIDKLKPEEEGNFYSTLGTEVHEIKQDWLEGKYPYENMLPRFKKWCEEFKVRQETEHHLKAPPVSGKTSEENRDGIFVNLDHYFTHTIPMQHDKVEVEPFVVATFTDNQNDTKYYLQGYVDEIMEHDGKVYIIDDKSSSISGYTGKKLIEKSYQLFTYALALYQMRGIPLENMVCRYDMLKYTNVSYMLKNGNMKVTKAERNQWITKMEKQFAKDFKALGYDETSTNMMIEMAAVEGNILEFPQEIQDKYTLSNCYIDIEITPEIMKEFHDNMVKTLRQITEFESTEQDEQFIRGGIEYSEQFFCQNLCDVREHCSHFKAWKEANHIGEEYEKYEDTIDEIVEGDSSNPLDDFDLNTQNNEESTDLDDFFSNF